MKLFRFAQNSSHGRNLMNANNLFAECSAYATLATVRREDVSGVVQCLMVCVDGGFF